MSEPGSPPVAEKKKRKPRGWLGLLLFMLVLAVLVAGAWYLMPRTQAPSSAAGGFGRGRFGGGVTVGAAVAEQGRLPVVLDALGTVTSPLTAEVVPQVSGIMTEVLFQEGQQVEQGQVLARVDARPYQQALEQARAQQARDEAQLAAAKVTLARYQTLWKQDSIARQELDTQAALVQQLQAAVAADRANVDTAQLNLDYTEVRAPASGVIGLRAVDRGNLVSANGSAVATITQMAPMDVAFSIPQDRLPAVQQARAGSILPVTVLDRTRSEVLALGEFLTLDNQIDAASGTVRAKARFANDDLRLFPNQFVNARLQLGFVEGVLVPVTAVRSSLDGDYVYVIDAEQVAHMRHVTQGLGGAERVLITEGLQAGERVVSEGGDRVKEGEHVKVAAPPEAVDESAQPAAGAATAAQPMPSDEGARGPRRRPGAAGQ